MIKNQGNKFDMKRKNEHCMESTGITEWFENKKKQLVAISPTSKLRLNYIMFVEM